MTGKYVIIGDGNAGATAAEKLRESSEDAEVTVLTDESEPLYNRIMLKNYMKGTLPKQYTKVHDESWYEDRNIDLQLDTKVVNVDTKQNIVETDEGGKISYDRLLIATGGSPRKLPQDEGYDNLHYMWTMHDAEIIRESAENSDEAVVVGGGLLGIDLAVAYAENNCETHYLIRGENWWSRGLDKEGAEIIHEKMEEKGVNVVTETEIGEIQAEENEVEKLVSRSGQEFGCDVLAVAIGQTPNSKFIELEKNEAGMIETDSFLNTSEEDIFAAGNMVDYYSPVFEKRTVKGSWDHSEAMGEAAARNMMEMDEKFDYVNTYGVGHFDVQFLAIGDWNGKALSRKYSDEEYRRLFFKENRLVGAVMIGYTKGQEKIKDLINEKEELSDREALLDKSFWE